MAKQIWSPEDGDEVIMKDGRIGKVSDLSRDPESDDSDGSWTFDVTFDETDSKGDDDEEVTATYSELRKRWEE